MARPRSPIIVEIAWLAYFIVVFVLVVNLLLALVVRPHNFSEMIAIVLAAIIAALAMIFTRVWWTARNRTR